MKKQVRRRKKLAPFSLNIEELQAFCSALSEEFDNPDDVSVSVVVKLPGGVSLEFESIEEMIGHPSLPDVINEYKIRMRDRKFILDRDGKRQSLWIEYPDLLGAKATISASSEKEVWCAGVVEATSSVLRKHRVWHYWIPRNFLFWIISFPLFYFGFFLGWPDYMGRVYWPLILMLPVFLMGFAPNHIIPAGAIRVKEKEGFIRRYSTQLTVIAALTSATVLVIGLFKSWIFGS